MLTWPTHGSDEELTSAKEGIPENIYKQMEKSFRRLWGSGDDVQRDSMLDGISVLTEMNFIKNIKYIVGYECPFLGKMFYLYFANGFD